VEIEFTWHAERQLQRRKVPREAVADVLENYHTSRPTPRRDGALLTVIYVGDIEGRNLKVYVIRDSSPTKVVTVVWEGDD